MAKNPAAKPKNPAAPKKGPAKPRTPRKSAVAGGTPADPAKVPAVAGLSGVVKYPYDKFVPATEPTFPVFGDPWGEFTRDERMAYAEAHNREAATHGDFVEEARKTPMFVLEVTRDLQKRRAGTVAGDVLNWMVEAAFLPNVERWQIPDPDAPQDGENTPTWVQVYCPPGDQIHQLWPLSNDPDEVWTHTWRAMLPEGMVTCTGGKLAAGNQEAGLAASAVFASNVRELASKPLDVNLLYRLHIAHRSRGLG